MFNRFLVILLFSFSSLLAIDEGSGYATINAGYFNAELEGLDTNARALHITELNDINLTNLAQLQTMPDLEALRISYVKEPVEKQMELIGTLPYLKQLGFIARYDWSAPDFSFIPLVEYSQVEELSLAVASLSLERLSEINAIPTLKKVSFTLCERYYQGSNRAEPTHLEILNALDQVPVLHFVDTYFNAEQIEQLKYVSLPNLQELLICGREYCVGGQTCGPATVKGIRIDIMAPNLKRLFLNNTNVTGLTVSHLSNMKQLEVVDLAATHVTSGAVKNLSKIKGLSSINLSQNRIKGADFSLLANLPQLQTLDLSGSDITRSDLLTLHALKQLKTLVISGLTSTTIRPEDIEQLKEALSNTQVVSGK